MKRTLNLRVKKNIYVYASIASGTRCGETRASHRFLELIPYDRCSLNNEPSSSYFEKKEKKEEEEKMNVNH